METFTAVSLEEAKHLGLIPEAPPVHVTRLAAVVAVVRLHVPPGEPWETNFRDVFVPNEVLQHRPLFGLESAFEACVPHEPPSIYACPDLTPTEEFSAYRGVRKEGNERLFHEHRFGDAIDQARDAVTQYLRAPGRQARQILAYAWPFLWLQWNDREPTDIVLLSDGVNGGVRALRSNELQRD